MLPVSVVTRKVACLAPKSTAPSDWRVRPAAKGPEADEMRTVMLTRALPAELVADAERATTVTAAGPDPQAAATARPAATAAMPSLFLMAPPSGRGDRRVRTNPSGPFGFPERGYRRDGRDRGHGRTRTRPPDLGPRRSNSVGAHEQAAHPGVNQDRAEGAVSAVGRFDVRAFLRERGVPDEEISAAEAQRTLPLLVIDQLLFPGRPRYDEETLVEKVGVDREYARALWRAMGFPGLPEGEVAFYDDDLEALRAAVIGDPMRELLPNLVHQTRVTSAAMTRVAEQSTDDIERLLNDLREQGAPDEEAVRLMVSVFQVERFEKLLWYMFRRQ